MRRETNNKVREPGKGKTKRAANLAQNIPRGGTPIRNSIPQKPDNKESEEAVAANSERR